MKRIIIIPTLNEEKTIASTLAQVKKEDVVVVDGFSTDNTRYIANQLGVKVIERKEITYTCGILDGLGWALEKGYDQMVVMDAESHLFSDIYPFLNKKGVILAGARHQEEKSLIRHIISGIGKRYLQKRFPKLIKDPSNGFRAYTRDFAGHLMKFPSLRKAPSYAFNCAVAVHMTEWKVEEFPMSYREGRSFLTFKELTQATKFLASFEIGTPIYKPTLDEVVEFLNLHHGLTFKQFIARKRK